MFSKLQKSGFLGALIAGIGLSLALASEYSTRELRCEVGVDGQVLANLSYRPYDRVNLEKEFLEDGNFVVAMKRDGEGDRVVVALAPHQWFFNLEPLSGPLLPVTNPGSRAMTLTPDAPRAEIEITAQDKLVRVSCEMS